MDIGGRGICQPAKGPLGRALRAIRHDLHLSQQRVADIAGVNQSTISRLERGGGNWTLFCRIVETLGGRPVITVERVHTERELMDAYLAGEPLPADDPAMSSVDDLW